MNTRWTTTLKGQKILLPLFEIASNPTIKLSEIKQRRFNIIDRNQLVPPGVVVVTDEEFVGIIPEEVGTGWRW